MTEPIDQLARMLCSSNYVMAFTGAGISTDSGIPDFRSKGDGLWERIDPGLLSIGTLRSDPELFYRYYREMDNVLADREPNSGHLALVELARLRIIRAVVTQNIDGLHQKAGSKRVFEVHGNLRGCRCMACRTEYPYLLLREKLREKKLPLSPCCRKVLRPNVVLFGDPMADDFATAREEAFRSDFALVIGTSLTVYPAAEIPLAVGRFAIINREETALDEQAVLRISGPISKVLTVLTERVRKQRNDVIDKS
ncbi:MAG: NAD-dependent deacylase [Negativicutes bacterium]|nr:NAD-dependent deacylase [Negativicutes bacterium]